MIIRYMLCWCISIIYPTVNYYNLYVQYTYIHLVVIVIMSFSSCLWQCNMHCSAVVTASSSPEYWNTFISEPWYDQEGSYFCRHATSGAWYELLSRLWATLRRDGGMLRVHRAAILNLQHTPPSLVRRCRNHGNKDLCSKHSRGNNLKTQTSRSRQHLQSRSLRDR